MSTVDPNIVEKVKKLLALGARGDVHEAALAMEMAQRLMQQHGLTAEAVEVGEVVEEGLRSIATATRAKGWELRLARGVADAFGCGLLFKRGNTWTSGKEQYGTWLFVGPKAEAQLAVYAAHVLQRQLGKARRAFIAKLTEQGALSRAYKAGEADSYCSGWVASALSKVRRLDPNPARQRALESHMEKYQAAGQVKTQQGRGSFAARASGERDGADAELNRPVDGGSSAGALGEGRKALGSGS